MTSRRVNTGDIQHSDIQPIRGSKVAGCTVVLVAPILPTLVLIKKKGCS